MESYIELESYIEKVNLEEFEKDLQGKQNDELHAIYEICLSKKSPELELFRKLELCFKKGCKKNYVNNDTGKAAINYAAESLNFKILCLLIYYSEVEYINNIDHRYQNQTPLNYLASQLTWENAGEIRECMELLLRNGAAVNIEDGSGHVPLSYVMNSELKPDDQYELIYTLLQRYKTTEDELVKEAWKYIKANHSKRHEDLKRACLDDMIAKRKALENKNYLYLKRRLSDGYLRKFTLKGNYMINLMERYDHQRDKHTLEILKQILSISSNDFNSEILNDSMSYGNQIFEELLKTPDLRLDYVKVAKYLIKNMPSGSNKEEEHTKYVDLFRILLKSKEGLASDADKDGLPLLDYAAMKRNEVAIEELLNHGAYMGVRSDYRRLPIKNIRPEVLEEHLDNCIKVDDVKSNDSNITIDLKNISHPPQKGTNVNPQTYYNDMTFIMHIRKSRNLQHLLNHPTVTTLLAHKWLKYSNLFYTHFVIYLLFTFLLTILIISDVGSNMIRVLWLPIILYLIMHEGIQFYISPVHYIREFFDNFLDILVILLSLLTCFKFPSRSIETFTLLSAYMKLFSHMRLLPIKWISKPLCLLFVVIKTVFESGILILVVLLFGLCFHLQFGKTAQSELTDDKKMNLSFANISSSLLKAFIMSTGEYDASSITITSQWDYVLLFVFVIIVGISLFNQLIAAALNDIQLIQNQAETYTAINRMNILNTCDALLFYNNWWFLRFLKKPSDHSLEKITIHQYEYPLKVTPIYYPNTTTNCIINLEAKGDNETEGTARSHRPLLNKQGCVLPTSSFGRPVQSFIPKNGFLGFFKNKFHIDYKTFKRAIKIAKSHSNKDQTMSEQIKKQLSDLKRDQNKLVQELRQLRQNINN